MSEFSKLVEKAGILNIQEDKIVNVSSNANFTCECYACQCDGGCDCVCQQSCDAGPCYGL